MAYDFPNAPTVGQISNGYTWDGEKWTSGTGFGAIYMSDAAPAAPVGSLWYQSSTGMLFVRYQDVDSAQWISIPGGVADVIRFGAQTLTVPQQTQARQNIYAAPFDAMSWSGLQVNGGFEVSQENGGATVTLSNGNTRYLVDGFIGYSNSGVGVMKGGQLNFAVGANITGHLSSVFMQVVTAYSSVAAADRADFMHFVEAYRWTRLGYGSAISAMPVTFSFWVYADASGTACLSIRNLAITRSYVATFTVTGGVWQYKTITIPGCPDGVWTTGTAIGAYLAFNFMCGSSSQTTTPNSWATGNFVGAPSSSNFFTAVNNMVVIGGLTIIPGIEGPSAAQSPRIVRPYDQELPTCMRYLEAWDNGTYAGMSAYLVSSTIARAGCQFKVPKRSAPVLLVKSAGGVNVNYVGGNVNTPTLTLQGAGINGAFVDFTFPGTPFTQGQGCSYGISAGSVFFDARM